MSELPKSPHQAVMSRDEREESAIVLVAIANVAQPEEGVGLVKRFSGQDLVDLFHEMDRPDSDKAILGVQLAIPPVLNGTSRWIAEAVIDFARVKLFGVGNFGEDTYAYRLASKNVFTNSAKIDPSDILEWRSIYEVSNAKGTDDDHELIAHQEWLSTVITRIVNAANLSEGVADSK